MVAWHLYVEIPTVLIVLTASLHNDQHCQTCRMACYKLEEYETALEAFEAGGTQAGDKNPSFSIWAQKCRIALAGV
jgi:hypothetical protein